MNVGVANECFLQAILSSQHVSQSLVRLERYLYVARRRGLCIGDGDRSLQRLFSGLILACIGIGLSKLEQELWIAKSCADMGGSVSFANQEHGAGLSVGAHLVATYPS